MFSPRPSPPKKTLSFWAGVSSEKTIKNDPNIFGHFQSYSQSKTIYIGTSQPQKTWLQCFGNKLFLIVFLKQNNLWKTNVKVNQSQKSGVQIFGHFQLYF